ncbi:MAG: hypothetical protein ACKO38_07875 [Planctomycetota bacterium]
MGTRNTRFWLRTGIWLGAWPASLGIAGCANHADVTPPPPLGVVVDEIFKTQEENAEAIKYVIHVHEFEINRTTKEGDNPGGWRLNEYGEEHLRQLALNLKRGDRYPVVVERSQSSSRPGTEFGYPVHYNDDLDARRRRTVVAVLTALGVPDADERVIVAPSFGIDMEATRAAQAYMMSGGGGGGGMGGGGGGGMGGGGMF